MTFKTNLWEHWASYSGLKDDWWLLVILSTGLFLGQVRGHVQISSKFASKNNNIRSEKNHSICWLWTIHSGLKTRMTCPKSAYGTIFFGMNLDEIWTWSLIFIICKTKWSQIVRTCLTTLLLHFEPVLTHGIHRATNCLRNSTHRLIQNYIIQKQGSN